MEGLLSADDDSLASDSDTDFVAGSPGFIAVPAAAADTSISDAADAPISVADVGPVSLSVAAQPQPQFQSQP